MSPVYKVGFILAIPVGLLTMWDIVPRVKDSLKILYIGVLFGAGIAYNKNIRQAFSKASEAVNNNFTVYYIKQTANEYKSKTSHPKWNPQQQVASKDELSPK